MNRLSLYTIKFLLVALIFLNSPGLRAGFTDYFTGFEAQAGMEYPLQVGFRVRKAFSKGFYATGGLGFVPGFFTESGLSMLSAMGVVGQNTGEVIANSMAGGLYIDLRGGMSFSGELGWFVEGGYAYLAGSGSNSDPQVVERALGSQSSSIFFFNDRISTSSTMHMITVHGGYSWQLGEHWLLTANAGIVKPMAPTVEVDYTSTSSTSFTRDRTERDLKRYLEDQIISSVFFTTVGAWLSYEF